MKPAGTDSPGSLQASSLYVLASGTARFGIAIITAPLLVRLLGVSDFGIWSMISAVVFAVGVLELGLNAALTNFLAAERARGDWGAAGKTVATSFLLTTLFGTLATAICLAAAPGICGFLFERTEDRMEALHGLQVLALVLVPRFWQQWAGATEAAMLRFDLQSLIETPSTTLVQIGSVVVVAAGGRSSGLAAWWVGVTLLTCAAHAIALRRCRPARDGDLGWSVDVGRRLLRFGFMSWVTNVGQALCSTLDRVIVGWILGPAAAGIYGATVSVTSKIAELCQLPMKVLPTAVSAAQAVGNFARVRYVFLQGTRVNALVVCTAAMPLLLWSPLAAQVMVGGEHADSAATLMRMLALTAAIAALTQSAAVTVLGIHHPEVSARWSLASGLLTCLGIMLCAKFWGLSGAAIGTAGYWLNCGMAIETLGLLQRLETHPEDRTAGFAPAPYRQTPVNLEYLAIIGWAVTGLAGGFLLSQSAWFEGLAWWIKIGIHLLFAGGLVFRIAGAELRQKLFSSALSIIQSRLGGTSPEPVA